MDLICNELSFYPLAENVNMAEQRFRLFLKTFKAAKNKFGFGHIRFPQNFSGQKITNTITFFEFISSLKNQTLKNLILDLCRAPFLDDLDEKELTVYFESIYSIIGVELPTDEPPIGLPVSYIKSYPAISFDAHIFWRNRKILIKKSDESNLENVYFRSYNICLENDIYSEELEEWANHSMPEFLISEDFLRKYLGFTKFDVVFSKSFFEQFFEVKRNNEKTFKYLLLLMKDVQLHPFTGGMGQTENLKHRSKEASKRITQLDRLSYTLENDIVTFLACKGHYDFH